MFIFVLMRQRWFHFFDLNIYDNSLLQRVYYWMTSLKVIKDYPVFGVGWAGLGDVFMRYKPIGGNFSSYSHNVFLQLMAETGILGLLSFIWLVFIFLKTALRVIKINDEDQILKIGLFCASVSFLLHNLIDFSFFFSQAAFFWWIILGLFSNFYRRNA